MPKGLLEMCETSFPGEIISWLKLNLWQEFDGLAQSSTAFGAKFDELDLADDS